MSERRDLSRLQLLGVLFVLYLSALAVVVVAVRDHSAEARRNRAATCLLLDQLGADPQTAAERWPCDDLGR